MAHNRVLTALLTALAAWVGLMTAPARADTGSEPSIVLIMVDGIRPDIVAEEVAAGRLPNIRKHFYEDGTRFDNSYAPASLTVPAWSAILTGADVDHSGIKGNETFNRETKVIENYLDWRRDLISKKLRQHGRAYRQIRRAGNAMIFDWFDRAGKIVDRKWVPDDKSDESEIFFTFFPINDQFPDYLNTSILGHAVNTDIWEQTGLRNALLKLLFDHSGVQALDRYGVDQVLKVIADTKSKKKKLIGAYLASAGDTFLTDYERGRRALTQLDYQIGRIFEGLRRSRYNDSLVVLVGDHGFLGGQESAGDNFHNPLRGESYALTATNLSYYLSGWYNKPGYADYNFNVESPYAAEGKFSLMNFSEIEANPFQCTNLARVDFSQLKSCESYVSSHPEKITAAVTSSGTISLPYARRDSGDWATANNWYTLTHYQLGIYPDGKPMVKNLVKDLEDFTIDNLAVFSSSLAQKIGNKPLDWLAIVVSKDELAASPKAIAALGEKPEDDVVLVHKSADRQALILHRRTEQEKDLYRYVPIKNFNQTESGEISFDLNPSYDPFGYSGHPLVDRRSEGKEISDTEWFAAYHSPRQWAARYTKTAFPNTVSALHKFTSYSGLMAGMRSRLRPDIYLNPNYGHVFTVNNDVSESHHGMWQKEAVQNLFMLSGPGVKKGYHVSSPVFATDVMPTLLKAANMGSRLRLIEVPDMPLDGKVIQEALE